MADHALCTWEEQYVLHKYTIHRRVYQPEIKVLRSGTFEPDQHRQVIENLIDDLCWGVLEEFTKRNLPYSWSMNFTSGSFLIFVDESCSMNTNQRLAVLGIQVVRDIPYGNAYVSPSDGNCIGSLLHKQNSFLLSRRYFLRNMPAFYFPRTEELNHTSWEQNGKYPQVMDIFLLALCFYCTKRKGMNIGFVFFL